MNAGEMADAVIELLDLDRPDALIESADRIDGEPAVGLIDRDGVEWFLTVERA